MGISVCFDQSNDIVSNQPDTPVFPCLPSPSLSHFPQHPSTKLCRYVSLLILLLRNLEFIASVSDGKIEMHHSEYINNLVTHGFGFLCGEYN